MTKGKIGGLTIATRRDGVHINSAAAHPRLADATTGGVIDRRRIEELPLVTRNPESKPITATR